MRLSSEDKALAQKWISEYIVMEASGDANMTTEFILTYVDGAQWQPTPAGAAVLFDELRDVNEYLTREHVNTIVAALKDGKYSRNTARTYEELEHDSGIRHRSASRSPERNGAQSNQQYDNPGNQQYNNDRQGGRRREDSRRQDRSRSRERGGRYGDESARGGAYAGYPPHGGHGAQGSTAESGGMFGGRSTGPAYEPASYNGARSGYGGGYVAPPPTGMGFATPLLPQPPLPTGFGSFAHAQAHVMQPPLAAAAGGWGSSATVVSAPYSDGYAQQGPRQGGGYSHGQRQGGRQGPQDRRRQTDHAGDSSARKSLKVYPVGGPTSGLGQLAAWFSRYGTVTQLVNATEVGAGGGSSSGAKHMYIQMKSHEEALAVLEAWRSGIAVCDDRAIQLDWAAREPGTGWTGQGQPPAQGRDEGPTSQYPSRPEARQTSAGSDSWRAAVFGKRGPAQWEDQGSGRSAGAEGGGDGAAASQGAGQGAGAPPAKRVDAIEAGLEKANAVMDEKMAQLAALNAPLQEQQKRFAELSKQKESLSKEEYTAIAKDIKEKLKAIVEQQTNLKNAVNTAKKAVEMQKANVDKWAASAGARGSHGPVAGSAAAGAGTGIGGVDGGMSAGPHSSAVAPRTAAEGATGAVNMPDADDAAAGHRRDDDDVEIQLDDDI